MVTGGGSGRVEPELKFDEPPADKQGWYPTLHCWDEREGSFPGAHYWDGKEWREDEAVGQPGSGWTNASIVYWRITFPTKAEAERFAEEHDPDR